MTMLHEQIRELAARATKGTFVAAPYSSVVGAPLVAAPSGRPIASITYLDLGKGFRGHDAESKANGDLIALLLNNLEAIASALDLAERVRALTSYEGDSVTILSANPDFNGEPNHAIECCGDWTDWKDRRFAHDDFLECFRIAAITKEAQG